MPITNQQLLQILPNTGPVAGVFLSALNDAMVHFKIDSRLRVAAFLAQVGHESDQLRTLVENLNYSAEGLIRTWPKRFNLTTATAVARKPEQIANIVYASRLDLLTKPELLEQPVYAALSAAWFWSSNGLSELANAGRFEAITRKVNGGNGQADRLAIYNRALDVLV